MRSHMAIRISAVNGRKHSVKDMAGGFLGGNQSGSIVGAGDVDVIHIDAAPVSGSVTGKTGITDEWNVGAGAVGGFYRPAVIGRVCVRNGRRNGGIRKRADEVGDRGFTIHPQVVIHDDEAAAEV